MKERALHRWFAPVLLALLVLLPLVTDRYVQYIVNLVLVYVIIAIGLNLLLGYAGQFAFAHAALMGIGAYTAALLMFRLGVSFWIALPVAGIVATIIGSLGALPALRMKRVYLALVTLAFAELIQWVLIHWKGLTFGTDGVKVAAPMFFGISLKGDHRMFYLLLAVTVLLYVIGKRIVESRIGRSFVAIRENEIVAQCNGINIAWTKGLVFGLSAFYAGIGGALFAVTLGFIVPESFGMFQLVLHFSIVVIGGLISMYGSVLGAVRAHHATRGVARLPVRAGDGLRHPPHHLRHLHAGRTRRPRQAQGPPPRRDPLAQLAQARARQQRASKCAPPRPSRAEGGE